MAVNQQGQRLTEDGLSAPVTTLPDHVSCKAHRRYWLTCAQYEGLIAACGNRCQACHRPAAESLPARKLFIDHHQWRGSWAVRGLLCHRCNALLTTDRPDPEWAAEYLAAPWFEEAYPAMGVPLDCPPEPPIGKTFYSPTRVMWKRHPGFWRNTSFALVAPHSWYDLYRRYGPLNLRRGVPLLRAALPVDLREHV